MYYSIVAVIGDAVPLSLRLIADPVRWRLLRELAGGDLRVRELVAATGEAQNLISYHLRRLRARADRGGGGATPWARIRGAPSGGR